MNTHSSRHSWVSAGGDGMTLAKVKVGARWIVIGASVFLSIQASRASTVLSPFDAELNVLTGGCSHTIVGFDGLFTACDVTGATAEADASSVGPIVHIAGEASASAAIPASAAVIGGYEFEIIS